MIDVFNSVFGVYEPLRDSSGAVVSGLAGVDWSWIFGLVISIVFMVSLFRLLGGVFKR